MRAKEFTINIPINIKINSDGSVEQSSPDEELDDNETGTFVPPLQRKLELMKRNSGVDSVYDGEDEDIIGD